MGSRSTKRSNESESKREGGSERRKRRSRLHVSSNGGRVARLVPGMGLFDQQTAGQMLAKVAEQLLGRAGTVGQLQLLQVAQLDQAGQAGRGEQRAAGQGQHLQVAHRAEMLQAKVPDLGAPAQEQGGQRQHRGDVAHADVDKYKTGGNQHKD
uniref:Uncharacterized protein n=1 Tax=Anopheles merus TaxID=30066 RepID=A0A182VNA5_ANOME